MSRVKDEAAIRAVFDFFDRYQAGQMERIDKNYLTALVCLAGLYQFKCPEQSQQYAKAKFIWNAFAHQTYGRAQFAAEIYTEGEENLSRYYDIQLALDVLAEADRQLKSEAEFKKLLSKRDDDNDLIS